MNKIDFKSFLIGAMGMIVVGLSINATELPESKSAIADSIHGIWVFSGHSWSHKTTYRTYELEDILGDKE